MIAFKIAATLFFISIVVGAFCALKIKPWTPSLWDVSAAMSLVASFFFGVSSAVFLIWSLP